VTRAFVSREHLTPDPQDRHDELMATAPTTWPAPLRRHMDLVGPNLTCAQGIADSVAGWLAGQESDR
jgi:hypothetical protein